MNKVALFTAIAEHKSYLLDKQFENYATLDDIAEVWYYINNSSPEFSAKVEQKCKDFGFHFKDMGMISPRNGITDNARPYSKSLDHFYHYARTHDIDYIIMNGGDNTLQKDHVKLLEYFSDPKVGLVSGMCYLRLAGEIYPYTVANLGSSGLVAASKQGYEDAKLKYLYPNKIPEDKVYIWGDKYTTVPMMSFSTDDYIDFTRIHNEVMNNGGPRTYEDCITIPSPGMFIPKRFFVLKNGASKWWSTDIFLERRVMDLGYKLLMDSSVLTGHWMENGEEVR